MTPETAEFVIQNKSGLHTRPGAVLVNIAKQFNSDIQIVNITSAGKPVNAKSLMKLMGIGVRSGHTIRVLATGDDARLAIDAISEGIESGLGE
jgi:phosphocarrier protein FPr